MIATVSNMQTLENAGIRNAIVYSPTTAEEYSATPGDYWYMGTDEPFLDTNHDEMILVERVTVMLEIELDDTGIPYEYELEVTERTAP